MTTRLDRNPIRRALLAVLLCAAALVLTAVPAAAKGANATYPVPPPHTPPPATPPASPPPSLPRTGSNTMTLATVGGATVLVGAGLVLVAKRRRQAALLA